MPIFEYRCNDCGSIFEVLVISKNDRENISCDKCCSAQVSKLLSAGAAINSITADTPASPPPGCGGCANRSGFS